MADLTPLSDEKLAELYKNTGENTFLITLFNRYKSLIYGIGFNYMENHEEAKDLVQDIYLKIHEKLKKNDVANFKAWLKRVVINACIDRVNLNNKHKSDELQDWLQEDIEEPDWKPSLQEKEILFSKLELCLETLDKNQKTAIELFYFNKKTYQEIGSALEESYDKVRSFLQNGRQKLHKCIKNSLHG